MDPNACFARLLREIALDQLRSARAAWDDLDGWIARGGFLPTRLVEDDDLYRAYRTGFGTFIRVARAKGLT